MVACSKTCCFSKVVKLWVKSNITFLHAKSKFSFNLELLNVLIRVFSEVL
jgi:hypothetical protein